MYILAIDLETTGLKAGYHEVCQIGCILLDSQLEKIGSYQSLVRIKYPGRGISESFNVFEFNHIDPDKLENAPVPKQVIDKLLKWIKGKIDEPLRKVILLGQNTRFDYTFLEEMFQEEGVEWPFDYHNLDLSTIYSVYKFLQHGHIPQHKGLQTICEDLGAVNDKPHDAMSDITVTVSLFKETCRKLKIDQ